MDSESTGNQRAQRNGFEEHRAVGKMADGAWGGLQ